MARRPVAFDAFSKKILSSAQPDAAQAPSIAASHLLATTPRSVLEVAMEVGFCSSQYFASAFRRITGMTPTAFREKLASCAPEGV